MQGYVPYKKSLNKRKLQIKSIFMIVLFFSLTITILVCLGISRKANKCFDKQTFHFVYTQKNKVKTDKNQIDLLKSVGGAGVVYFHKENFHLLANFYLKKDDANEIKDGMIQNFENSGILQLEVKTLSRSLQNKIKSNENAYLFFKKLYKFFEKFENLNMQYISGEVSEGKLVSTLIAEKLEFETIAKEFDSGDEKLFLDLKTYLNMVVLHFESFFNEFFSSTKKQSLVCMLGVNIALTKVELFNNL